MFVPCKICSGIIDYSPIRTTDTRIIRSRELMLCDSCLDEHDKEEEPVKLEFKKPQAKK